MFIIRIIMKDERSKEMIEGEAKEFSKKLREDISNRESGLVNLIGLEAIPVAMGVLLGGLGRSTGSEWIPAVPLTMDFMFNAQGYFSLRGLWGLAKYGFGVALPYADKFYLASYTLLDKIY